MNMRMDLYSQIVFSSAITENLPVIPDKTLGLQLRYTDRSKFAPSTNSILNNVTKMINKNIFYYYKFI